MTQFIHTVMQSQLTILVGTFFLTLFTSLIATPWVIRLVTAWGMVDKPDPRRVNKKPIPRGGGLAVYIAAMVGMFFCFYLLPGARNIENELHIVTYAISVSAICLLGFIDDKFDMRASVKLLGQIVIAIFVVYRGIHVTFPEAFGWANTPWIYGPLTVIWIVGLINAFNLIDGLDGLSSGVTLIACIGLAGTTLIRTHSLVMIAPYIILIGALLGFLRYNYNPASIFLGDTGSMYLGLLMATLPLVHQSTDTFVVSIFVPLLCMGVPIFDTLLAIFRRTLRGFLSKVQTGKLDTKVMTADADHMHHRLLRKYEGNQKKAVGFLYLLTGLFVFTAFCFALAEDRVVAIFLAAFVFFSFVFVRYLNDVELWDIGQLSFYMEDHVVSRRFMMPVYMIIDGTMLFCLLSLGLAITKAPLSSIYMIPFYMVSMAGLFVAFVLFGIYKMTWTRPSAFDQMRLLVAIFFGVLIVAVVLFFVPVDFDPMHYRALAFAGMAFPLTTFFVRVIKDFLSQASVTLEHKRLRTRSQSDSSIARTAIYGGGSHLHAYRLMYAFNFTHNNQALIAAFDDDKHLWGLQFNTVSIMGGLDHLKRHAQKLGITRIVLTMPALKPSNAKELLDFAKEHEIEVVQFAMTEEVVLSATNDPVDPTPISMTN